MACDRAFLAGVQGLSTVMIPYGASQMRWILWLAIFSIVQDVRAEEPSTFPNWIPNSYRTSPIVNTFLENIENNTLPKNKKDIETRSKSS